MSNQLKFLILYGISGILIWFFILPSYDGSGSSLLQLTPLTQKMDEQKKGLELQDTAKSLLENGKQFNVQYAEFKEEDKKKIMTAIPAGLDPVRLLNELTTLSDNIKDVGANVVTDMNSNGSDNGKSIYSATNVQIQFDPMDYDALYNYVIVLQNNLRLLNLKTFSMSVGQNNKIAGTLSFVAYYFNDSANITQSLDNDMSLSVSTSTPSALDSAINSPTFVEVRAISSLIRSLDNKIQAHPLLKDLNDTTILVDRQKITQRSNPFINKLE